MRIMIKLCILTAICVLSPDFAQTQDAPWIKADPVCQMLDVPAGSEPVSESDKKKAKGAFTQGAKIIIKYKETQNPEIVENAIPFLEEAVRIDRENESYQKVLLTAYKILANKAAQEEDYKDAILFGERMIRINSEAASDYVIRFTLGNNYFKFNKYDYAILHLQKAEELIQKEIEKKPQDESLKTLKCNLHVLAYSAYIETGDVEKASLEIEKGKRCANTEQQMRTLQTLDWMNTRRQFWGSEEGLNLQIEINKQTNAQNFDEAARLYRKLIEMYPDSSDIRKIEAVQLYALFRFQNLNHKAETIEYLLPWMKALPDTQSQNSSTYQSLRDCFSLMNYRLGMEKLTQNRFEAYCYLRQALTVRSNHSGQVYFGLLNLCRQNPSEVIRIGNRLLHGENALDTDQKRRVLEYLIYAYKSKNGLDEVKQMYRMYQDLISESREI